MGGIGGVLAPGRVRSLLAAQLIARMPNGIWPIAMLLHVDAATDSFAIGGLAVAVMVVARALAAPISTRMAPRMGARVVIATLAGVSAVGSLGFALGGHDGSSGGGFLLWAAVCGLATPPVQPVARIVIPRRLADDRRDAVFAVEASLQEIIFILGPLVAVGIAAALSPAAAILGGTALMLVGTGWFIGHRDVRLEPADATVARAFGAVLALRSVWGGVIVGFALVAGSSALEAGLVARYGDSDATVALLLGAYSASSLVGGLIASRWAGTRWAPRAWMGALLVAAGISLATILSSPWAIAVALTIGGLGVAPVLAAIALGVPRELAEHERVEALGWLDSGAVAGASSGFALAGMIVDVGGADAGLALAAGAAIVATLAAVLTPRR